MNCYRCSGHYYCDGADSDADGVHVHVPAKVPLAHCCSSDHQQGLTRNLVPYACIQYPALPALHLHRKLSKLKLVLAIDDGGDVRLENGGVGGCSWEEVLAKPRSRRVVEFEKHARGCFADSKQPAPAEVLL